MFTSTKLKQIVRSSWCYRPIIIPLKRFVFAGPWQVLFISFFQKKAQNQSSVCDREQFLSLATCDSHFSIAYPDFFIDHLMHEHFAVGIRLDEEYCEAADRELSSLNVSYIENPHLTIDIIAKIANDPVLLAVVSHYLKAKPHVQSSYYICTQKEADHVDIRANQFHQDYPDYLSLTLLVYLTDVDAYHGPHQILPGSLSVNSFRSLPAKIRRAFTKRQEHEVPITIFGQRGETVLENLQLLHRRVPCLDERKALFVNYCLRRR